MLDQAGHFSIAKALMEIMFTDDRQNSALSSMKCCLYNVKKGRSQADHDP